LQSLDQFGLTLVAVTGKGYRLQYPLQLLDQQCIHSQLTPDVQALLTQLEIQPIIDSTSAYLMALAQQSAATGRVCLAEYQTAGKGRRGRSWVSPFGHNIYLSLLWRYQNGPGALVGLSLAMGVAVVRALTMAGVEDLGLKWPNDIYWRGRKLAGILIEVSGESSGPCLAVIGLGLNVYLPPQQAESIEQAWVDLKQIMGEAVMQRRNTLVAMLLNEIVPVVADFENQGLPSIVTEWRRFDCMRGKQATLFIGELSFTGTVLGIDDQGLLLLEESTGKTSAFASGEVSFRAT
jgi:BirA family biotin operon repressor/biotin-[acetyl-CoA-carboxylase] ligase